MTPQYGGSFNWKLPITQNDKLSYLKFNQTLSRTKEDQEDAQLNDDKVAALFFNAKITDSEHEAEIKRVRIRVKQHHRLIILHEILNDVS
jgi:hypothetical protein